MSQRIVFIGAGNLATRLALELKEKGYLIEQVYSRTESSAVQLAKILQTNYTISPEKIVSGADIYIVALKDSVVGDVLSKVTFENKLVIHCSGSLPLSVLHSHSKNTGVLYLLQTFSKNQEVAFKEIPVFVEANSEENENLLLQLAKSISDRVALLESEKRMFLHIAAVFACNFVNHFYTIASDLLGSNGISFEILHPLIQETALKAMRTQPQKAQTGPAVRFDENIISTHLNALDSFPEFREMYRNISENIYNYHKKLYQ
jgi:predicted short-subunit dehydrogenase-like oxidoreductase (DUF2520 family)